MALINGTAGNDVLNGTAFRDRIYGFDGNDTINGGDGDDMLFGGAGNDIFKFQNHNHHEEDIIRDWNAGDLIDLSAFGITFDQVQQHKLAGDRIMIEIQQVGGYSLEVVGTSQPLTASDFIF